jgi:hypothetical protein
MTTTPSFEGVRLGDDRLGHRGRVDSDRDDATTMSSHARSFVDETPRSRGATARRRDDERRDDERATIRVETSDADETRDDADAKVFDRARRRAARENRGVSLADEYRRRRERERRPRTMEEALALMNEMMGARA